MSDGSRGRARCQTRVSGKKRSDSLFPRKCILLAAGLLSIGLTGCGANPGNLLGPSSPVNPQRLTSPADGFTMVELRPIMGPTLDVQQRLMRQLNELAHGSAIALFIPPSYQQLPIVQISLTAVREENRIHVGFISEVMDTSGQQVDRLRGEEVAVLAGSASVGPPSKQVTVQKGDTLSRIAARHGVTVANLKELNNLKTSVILVGQRLMVQTGMPQPSPWDSVTDDQILSIATKIMKSLAALPGRSKVAAR